MQGIVLLVIIGGAIAGWFIRQKKMNEIANAPLPPQQVSAVAGAQGLRDVLSILLMELEGGVEDRSVQMHGGGASLGLGGGVSLSVGNTGASHHHTGPDAQKVADLQTRMREVATTWNGLDAGVRDELAGRGVDAAFLETMLDREAPSSDSAAQQLAGTVRATLQMFSQPAG